MRRCVAADVRRGVTGSEGAWSVTDDDAIEFGEFDNGEFPDPVETDAKLIRLLAGWFAGGYFPPKEALPVSAYWPAGEQEYPWESEDAWELVTDVDRDAFLSVVRRILTGKDN